MTSFDWIDFRRLEGVEQEIREVFDQADDYMDEARKSAIVSAFSARLGNLMALSEVQHPEDNIVQDVEQDTAQDYGFKLEM